MSSVIDILSQLLRNEISLNPTSPIFQEKTKTFLIEHIEDLISTQQFFELPIQEILFLIQEVDFSLYGKRAKMIIQNLITATYHAHPNEAFHLFNSINCKFCDFSLNDCIEIMKLFNDSDLSTKIVEVYSYDSNSIEFDTEYEINKRDKEIQELKMVLDKTNDEKNMLLSYIKNGNITDIYLAVKNNDLNSVRYLIEFGGIDPNETNVKYSSLLHLSCYLGYLPIVKYLIEHAHANKEQRNSSGDTPIYHAASKGHLDIVQYLVEQQNVNLENRSNDGKTVLSLACSNGQLEIAKYLIEKCHCSFLIKDQNGDTPLHRACFFNRINIVRYLIEEQKCPFDLRANDGKTCLHLAAVHGSVDVLRYLLETHNADVNAVDENGDTPLHRAAENEKYDSVKILLEHGANKEITNREGKTPKDILSPNCEEIEQLLTN